MVKEVEKIEESLRLFAKSSAGIGGDDWIRESATLLHEITMKEENLGKYLKFKCIATSTGKSSVYDGLVFTKSSTIGDIPEEIKAPQLLLCEGSLDINKGDKHDASLRFSSIDEPNANIILVEKSVSEEYQKYFLCRGKKGDSKMKATVIKDMKHRLGRFPTRSEACKLFKLEDFVEDLDAGKKKTLMFFEGCDSITVLLKGSSTNELKLRKGLLQVAHNAIRNQHLSSPCFIVQFPYLKVQALDGGVGVVAPRAIDNEVSSLIACELHRLMEEKLPPPKPSPVSVICQHQEKFYELRRSCKLPEAQYIMSLNHCKDWDASGGKSGAVFVKTRDERLIIKEIDKAQLDSFNRFCTSYFEYLSEALESNSKTCLAKIFGLYEVTRDHRTKFLIVMENLVFNREVAAQYDLKGILRSAPKESLKGILRSAPKESRVLLDSDFKNDMKESPLQISPSARLNLELALRNDTEFLSGVNVMDYSLILAVDKKRHQLVCGIVDYLVPYDWKKKLESAAKSSVLKKPTVIPPAEYKERFLKFMLKELLAVEEASSSV